MCWWLLLECVHNLAAAHDVGNLCFCVGSVFVFSCVIGVVCVVVLVCVRLCGWCCFCCGVVWCVFCVRCVLIVVAA